MAEIRARQEEAARALLDKLRAFSDALSPDERALLGALLAPGIALALSPEQRADEVSGFGLDDPEPVAWRPGRLPDDLVDALLARGARVVEL